MSEFAEETTHEHGVVDTGHILSADEVFQLTRSICPSPCESDDESDAPIDVFEGGVLFENASLLPKSTALNLASSPNILDRNERNKTCINKNAAVFKKSRAFLVKRTHVKPRAIAFVHGHPTPNFNLNVLIGPEATPKTKVDISTGIQDKLKTRASASTGAKLSRKYQISVFVGAR
uniref:Uncharacterized protein n=1 Tax=Fibrocapsa japonica TaxID=94617 RepID=A0A7S2XUR5_9STRA|eukprot:CAMPEP_0113941460 /NCGR_PEP_ID=MMETSP1339-20121228/7362_1 /TAXON_ID=94617 /ORGANISM="Fibrocapsa japonica" /LENGTH=175 /DNA_ID=CAMNT_0000945607 /DNA_START=65 /DNA_END=592 /DNA_ORIENTATION=+ /assembly_acc=CAM_ASM_000762